jgi:hypothetical protein
MHLNDSKALTSLDIVEVESESNRLVARHSGEALHLAPPD